MANIKDKKENIKELSTEELESKLVSLEEDLRVLRFNMKGSKSKNVKKTKEIKRQIARVLTQLNSIKAKNIEK